MNKIKEIVQSYARMVNPTEEQKKVAEIRLATCVECPEFATNQVGIHYCKKCGCATKAKVFSPKGMQACPLDKWLI
jgi:hypothetical protein